MLKCCSRCHQERPFNQFSKDTSKKDGLRCYCKECYSIIQHQRRQPQIEANRAKRDAAQTEKLARTEKPCARCGQIKPVEAFGSHPSYCRECSRELDKQYREKPSRQARKKETSAAWGKANRKHISEYKKSRMLILEVYEAERGAANARNRRYYQQHKDKCFTHAAKRRKAIKALPSEKIDRFAIAGRDKWTCYICGQKVQKEDMSLDHVIPVALGGARTADNLRLAHITCNKRKGTKVVQTLMIGAGR